MALARKQIGEIWVESGRLMLADPLYMAQWRAGEFRQETEQPLNSYDEACKLTVEAPWYCSMMEGSVVVFAAALGDGNYPVYGYFNVRGRCVKVEVVMSIEASHPEDLPYWKARAGR